MLGLRASTIVACACAVLVSAGHTDTRLKDAKDANDAVFTMFLTFAICGIVLVLVHAGSFGHHPENEDDSKTDDYESLNASEPAGRTPRGGAQTMSDMKEEAVKEFVSSSATRTLLFMAACLCPGNCIRPHYTYYHTTDHDHTEGAKKMLEMSYSTTEVTIGTAFMITYTAVQVIAAYLALSNRLQTSWKITLVEMLQYGLIVSMFALALSSTVQNKNGINRYYDCQIDDGCEIYSSSAGAPRPVFDEF